jgi:hypothetical protein
MIIRSAYASNHELIKCIEKSNGHYLITAQKEIIDHELHFLYSRLHSDDPYI